jgi:hypothetical protein
MDFGDMARDSFVHGMVSVLVWGSIFGAIWLGAWLISLVVNLFRPKDEQDLMS